MSPMLSPATGGYGQKQGKGSSRELGLSKFVPTPGRQMAALSLIPAGRVLSTPRNIGRAWKWGAGGIANMHALSALYPIIGPDKKLGFRFGGTGGVMPLGMIPFLRFYSVPSTRKLPIPTYGFGFTAVDANQPRVGFVDFPREKGVEGGPSVSSSQHRGWHKRDRKQVTPPSAQTKQDGLSSAQRGFGGGTDNPRPRRRGSQSRRTAISRTITPMCPVHKQRHWCNVTRAIVSKR